MADVMDILRFGEIQINVGDNGELVLIKFAHPLAHSVDGFALPAEHAEEFARAIVVHANNVKFKRSLQ